MLALTDTAEFATKHRHTQLGAQRDQLLTKLLTTHTQTPPHMVHLNKTQTVCDTASSTTTAHPARTPTFPDLGYRAKFWCPPERVV